MKTKNYITACLILGVALTGCGMKQNSNAHMNRRLVEPQSSQASEVIVIEPLDVSEKAVPLVQTPRLIDSEGMTVATRILPPNGYTRILAEDGSFPMFLRNYGVKPEGSPVLLYDGREKGNQLAHEAVYTMHIEPEDFQQCADSVMRIYAEYLYEKGAYNQIRFQLVSGFTFDFATWSKGNKLVINGNQVSWGKNSANDASKASFEQYLHILFAYASTLSMSRESEEIPLSDLQIGDIFIKGGSPGHVVMVVDMAENEAGENVFLLAQGYMPAQEFHVLKNPNSEDSPWYNASEVTYPFQTPEYSFGEGSLKRPPYLN